MKNFSSFIEDLSTLISFKSVQGETKENMPFGEECNKALDFFLSLASSFGFEVKNYDGYAGEVVFGKGEEIGIIGHLDVVPAGIGWVTDPFTLTEKDGVYYGRGLVDDKSATLMCLYALKELKDSGILPQRKFRLFAGINEESGWKDVEYLKNKTTLPEYGFSPDANFPLSYAEKGITIVDFSIKKLKNFYSVKGGTVVNAVCDYASCRAKAEGINRTLLKKHGLILTDNNLIESFGKAAHGSLPHLGKNAIKPLLEYFKDMGEEVDDAISYLFNDKAGLFNIMTEQGKVTLSPDLIKEENEKIIISCDCRIPAPLQTKDLLGLFDSFGIPYKATEKHPSVMVEKDGWLVNCLLSAYKEVTGLDSQPQAIGGSTFARAFNKGCAFGPSFDGAKGNYHDANEFIEKEELLAAYDVYKKAIFNLAEK